jgi:hypothetical protein
MVSCRDSRPRSREEAKHGPWINGILRETGSGTENKRIGCFKVIALPAKDLTTRLESFQGTAGSFWSEQRSKRYLTTLSAMRSRTGKESETFNHETH